MNCLDKLKNLLINTTTNNLTYEQIAHNQPLISHKNCSLIRKVPIEIINYVCLDFLAFSEINSLSRVSKYFQASILISPQNLESDPRLKGTLTIQDIVFLINNFLKVEKTTLFQAFYKSISQAKGLDFEETKDPTFSKVEAKLFTDENLEAISKCHHLEHLNLNQIFPLRSNRKFSENTILKILEQCPRLNSIHLANIPRLTYKTGEVLWRNYTNIMSLNISGLKQFCYISLEMIIHNTNCLEMINLSRISHLSNDSICQIIKYFPQIKALHLQGLVLLNDQTFNLIANQCPDLKILDVSWIPNFTYKHYRNIKNNHPDLKIIYSHLPVVKIIDISKKIKNAFNFKC